MKKSFIYRIKDTYYVIGANTFSKLENAPELDYVELLQNALKKGNDRQISKYLEKIVRIANAYRVDAKEHYRLRDKLFKFIDELEKKDADAFLDLQAQVFRFDELAEKYLQEIV